MDFKRYKMEDISTFSQGKQVEIENQFLEKKENMKRFLRIVDFTNPNEPMRYVEDFGSRYYASSNDLIMIRYGSQTCGKVVTGKDGIIANNMFKITLDNNIVLNKYAYYYLKQGHIYDYLRNSQNSSTMPSINFGILKKLEIYVPSLDDQKKIIKILDDIDSKINNNDDLINNLYSLADNYYDNEIVLKTNETYLLQDIYDFQYGKGNNNPANGGIYPVYGSNGIIGGYTEYNNEESPVIGHIGANCGSLIFAYGKHFVTYNGIMCNIKNDNMRYLGYQIMRKVNFRNEIRGSSQPFISYDLLNNIKIPKISEVDVNKYESIFKNIYVMIGNLISENDNLSNLRDQLLPKLLSGEIDLSNIKF